MDAVLQWFYDVLLWLPRHFISALVDLFTAVWSLLPDIGLTALAQGLQTLTMNPGIVYLFVLFKMSDGFTVVLTAYISRFILRRIPGIG